MIMISHGMSNMQIFHVIYSTGSQDGLIVALDLHGTDRLTASVTQ